MRKFSNAACTKRCRDDGATAVEYAIVIAATAVIFSVAVSQYGDVLAGYIAGLFDAIFAD